MIRLAIFKSPGPTGDAVRLIAEDTGVFDVVLADSCSTPSKSLVEGRGVGGSGSDVDRR